MTAGKRTGRRRWTRWLWIVPVTVLVGTILQVLVLRFVDPPFSAFMATRQVVAWAHGDWRPGIEYQWLDLDRMAPSLPLALIAAEDQNFPVHSGFDFKAIEKARINNARGHKLRGASTISQQVAKNLFLWSGRSYVRKAVEAWYTVLMDANVAEFGDGIYGAQAASRHFFGKDASRLSAAESARLAAVLPSPLRYDAEHPGPYVKRRSNGIQRQMHHLGGGGALHRQR